MIKLCRFGSHTDQPPLVAIPGLDGTIGSVAPIIARLAQAREVIVVDYSAEINATLEALSAEIAAAVKAEGYALIDVMGQSIGTIITAQLASLYGLPVRKVVLVCTFTRLRWTILRLTVFSLRITPRWLYRLTSDLAVMLMCGPVGDGRDNPIFFAARNADQAELARRTRWEINRDFGLDLIRIRVPLLILMGEQDRFVPNARQEIEKLRTMFADHPTQVDAIENAGHTFLPHAAIALASEKIETFLG